jgi:hypothetical protein
MIQFDEPLVEATDEQRATVTQQIGHTRSAKPATEWKRGAGY